MHRCIPSIGGLGKYYGATYLNRLTRSLDPSSRPYNLNILNLLSPPPKNGSSPKPLETIRTYLLSPLILPAKPSSQVFAGGDHERFMAMLQQSADCWERISPFEERVCGLGRRVMPEVLVKVTEVFVCAWGLFLENGIPPIVQQCSSPPPAPKP